MNIEKVISFFNNYFKKRKKGDIHMANVLNVAAYIVDKIDNLTTMKLQKLVYYCQAWSLAWDDIPLFEEDFEAWANGPVCPELFEKHRGRFVIDKSFLSEYKNCEFSEEQKNTMDLVLDFYGDREPHWLSELTHKEAPWRNARMGVAPGERCNNIITKENMREYYGGLQ